MITFNKPYATGKELTYINQAITKGHISGNGLFTQWCNTFFCEMLNAPKALLTHSCTAALEMCAILLNIQPGDEIIIPSFTFVSTALAFTRMGAKIVYIDSEENTPNLDATKLEKYITGRTKAIVVVHYAGVACDMDFIMSLADKYQLWVVEDAAQAIGSYYKGQTLGAIGHLSTFSFHETKNIQCGEGGMLVINDPKFAERAEIIWEKGTNRARFFRGEIDKYTWVDTGSSYLPSDMNAAYLKAQLELLDDIQSRRIHLSTLYNKNLNVLVKQKKIKVISFPPYATNNGHIFYLICKDLDERTRLIEYLKHENIQSVFHYLGLHNSPYMLTIDNPTKQSLAQCQTYADTLLRLPLYYELTPQEIQYISSKIIDFYG
ncbi:dTDP-4-amino-4,6-dideoxygalactose transaminase [Halosquirtibacter xylanolyticus]|uniref:dTDP-4-amino-4,6-dideoxygalactose transaminase n=1 Tax=Halosquirtibacter xylanolyticus TaxID=3374599 RepID=UPI003749310B|nr:dTDP-4-amino-4,6-dideoxygalactose transaminase [Prolixibacteraceae bacterium]